MQPLWRVSARSLPCHLGSAASKRQASLTSAIERGIRRSKSAVDRRFPSSSSGDGVGTMDNINKSPSVRRPGQYDRQYRDGQDFEGAAPQRSYGREASDRNGALERRYTDAQPRQVARTLSADRSRSTQGDETAHRSMERPAGYGSKIPASIPYTTASSEFLYGTFAVMAALKARRRSIYKLYVLRSEDTELDRIEEVLRLAESRRVKVQYVGMNWANILDKMADHRPHNGVVMEVSQLPTTPIQQLESVENATDPIRVKLGKLASGSEIVSRTVRAKRYPFVLLLQSILDPGNLGAIIRSAYFLGVDAIIMTRSGTAPISAVTLKASAGAAEVMPLMTVSGPLNLVKNSKASGWQIFAAVSPSSESGLQSKHKFVGVREALVHGPCLLVLGGEGHGILPAIMREATGYVGIPQVMRDDHLNVVESLNVSVATALMISQFLEKLDEPASKVNERLTPRATDEKQKIF